MSAEAQKSPAPNTDDEIPAWLQQLGIPGIVDLHVHFMPDRVLQKVWSFFDQAEKFGTPGWKIHYRGSEEERLQQLKAMGVTAFPTLNYAHRPGMAQWLNEYSTQMAKAHPEVIHSATFYPESEAADTVRQALANGVKIFKIHIQVGNFSPLDPQLDEAWGLVAASGVPVVIHCGHGPHPGEHTGVEPIAELMRRHPQLVLIIAHAGLPQYEAFAQLAVEHSTVYLDTTMVGTDYMEKFAPTPPNYPQMLRSLSGKVVLGTDFPSIPYPYSHQLAALNRWGLGDQWLREALWETPRELLGW